MQKRNKVKLGIAMSFIGLSAIGISTTCLMTSCSSENSNQPITPYISSENSQYVKNNSVSLCFLYKVNWLNVLYALNQLLSKDGLDADESAVLLDIKNQSSNLNQYSSFQFGTGWMIDANYNNSNNIFNYYLDYYLATNEHVTDLTFDIQNSEICNVNYNLKLPVEQFADIEEFYIGQPINTEKLIYPGYENSNYIKISNTFPEIINFASPSGCTTLSNLDRSILIGNIGEQKINYIYKNSNVVQTTDLLDMSIIHFRSNVMFWPLKYKNLINMFNKPSLNVNDYKKWTYVTKLYYAEQLLEKGDLNSFKKVFPFASKDVWNTNPTVNIAGYPATSNFAYVNSGTTNELNKYVNTSKRKEVEFNNLGLISTANYPTGCTIGAQNIDLGGGSSGSMVIDNNNQIIGIYWGVLTIGSSTKTGLFIPFVNSIRPEYSLLNLLYKYYNQNQHKLGNTLLWKIFNNPNFPANDYNITK